MIYKSSDIICDVRVAIDQNMTSDGLITEADVETLSLDEIIGSKIVEGVRRVETSAPVHFLEEGHNFGDGVFWEELESGWVLLPDDFMRLIAFRMSDWERTVYSAISAEDPLYRRQSSRYKGLRGTAQRPVCAIVNRAEGKALEFYSCKSRNAQVTRASYIPYPRIDRNGGIDISERCYQAVVYTVAALTLTAFGEVNRATTLTDLAKTIFQ